ncbi:hypothetical protein [Actinomadura sp. 7K507]|uniref:hypothetical protein n=1 Tax=Actinomadura sp. 7K507 TaxID=2530365 RepID=UPI00104D89CB|nr:hypothetical protein [Actinomadura sp. 7K507]TDC93799.1 hypothetical protein E1285_09605 [Actinomadura sp. 7K507]
MIPAKGGWTVFCSEPVCDVMDSMPSMEKFFVEFFCDFALKAGTAVDMGHAPPGVRAKRQDVAYSLLVESSGIFIEYVVMMEIKEFYVTRMLLRS